jgi:asparagine synthase (glutamine-hydrolysing)
MCGIIGSVGSNIDKKTGLLTAYRGPDNLGVYVAEDVTLIHNRLSIIDLSEDANQPMESFDGRYVIVFNGEIYNYKSIRGRLIAKGYEFKTGSDSEVLLNGYIAWKEDVLHMLDGMFAFAIWDSYSKKIFCARDHIGIKPFFYIVQDNSFYFSSELKVIRDIFPELEIDKGSVSEYLIYNYIPAPKTIYKNALKLLPGHYLEFTLDERELRVKKWYAIPKIVELNIDYHDAVNLVRDKVSKSIKSHLVSDVPVGSFLSGGIDSSIIALEIAKFQENSKVFSIGYKSNSEYDEIKYAKIISKKLGLEHEIIYPDFSEMSILDTVDGIIDHMDEPYGNPTIAMTDILCKSAKKSVTVALIGDGADEVFGGYPRYHALSIANRFGKFMSIASPMLKAILSQFPETPSGNHFVRRAKSFLNSQDLPLGEKFQSWSSILNVKQLEGVSSSKGRVFLEKARKNFISNLFLDFENSPISGACYADQMSFLPNNLLEGADRMSMKNSFELRVPFVSREIIELSSSLRGDWKIGKGNAKRILKDAYSNELPLEIIERKKRGFNPPVWNWLQDNKPFIYSFLNNKSRINVLFIDGYIEGVLSDFYSKTIDHSSHIWSLLVLERWLENNQKHL